MLYKYHGCGNDFIIGFYDEKIEEKYTYSEFTKKICNRNTGVGADGLIVGKWDGANYEMVFYNQDGTRGLMCGNGIRCLSSFLYENNCFTSNEFEIKTLTGIRNIKKINDNYVCNMGTPSYDAKLLDIDTNDKTFIDKIIKYNDIDFLTTAVFMTVHHLCVIVDNVINITTDVGKYLCTHSLFKKGINVNFIQIIDRDNIIVRTFERGVGWTKACGSGSCASFSYLYDKGIVNECVNVHLEYGQLQISIKDSMIIMSGPAKKICGIDFYN